MSTHQPRAARGTFAPSDPSTVLDDPAAFGERVRAELRARRDARAAGVRTAADLADAMGEGHPLLSQRLRGVRPMPRDLAERIAAELGLSLDALTGEGDGGASAVESSNETQRARKPA